MVATVCAGDMDSDSKLEIIAQSYALGLVFGYEFDNSTGSTVGWWCECGDAQRTSCAD